MKHVRQVNIASYRGLSNIEIGGLADVNVFLGPSNSGKTSALEAVYLASSEHGLADALRRIIRSRGGAGAPSVFSLFPNLDTNSRIDVTLGMNGADHTQLDASLFVTQDDRHLLTMSFDEGRGYSTEFVVKFDPSNSDFTDITSDPDPDDEKPVKDVGKAAFVSPAELTDVDVFDDRYSAAYLSEMLPSLLETLRSVYPLLKDIRPVKVDADRWMSYVQIGSGVYPMFAMGDGFKAAMVLLSHALTPGTAAARHPRGFSAYWWAGGTLEEHRRSGRRAGEPSDNRHAELGIPGHSPQGLPGARSGSERDALRAQRREHRYLPSHFRLRHPGRPPPHWRRPQEIGPGA